MKIILSISFILLCSSVFAKKVKFAVDMRNQVVNATGVHIVGDFQEAAGLGTNFGVLTPMAQEGTSSIYSIVVDIPAFQKYEYKFANGDLFYEVEFVPTESRVGYDFVDNRWLYVDSLANDTTFVGAILYAENAPYSYKLARLLVDLTNEGGISANGVHIVGDFNAFNPTETTIISLQGNAVYEGIVYLADGTYEYKFLNGNTLADAETVPGTCEVNSNRELTINAHTVYGQVCFSACTACLNAGIDEVAENSINVYPVPFHDFVTVSFSEPTTDQVFLTDLSGKIIETYQLNNVTKFNIYSNHLNPGVYFLQFDNASEHSSIKLILE